MTQNTERVSIETITPAMADRMLADSKSQRPVDYRHVSEIARDIEQGRFAMNNDMVVIDRFGNVLNGQHRLLACIEAGKEIVCTVRRGAPPEAFGLCDIGVRTRHQADTVAMLMGATKRAHAEAAALSALVAYDTGRISAASGWQRLRVADVAAQWEKYSTEVTASVEQTKKVPSVLGFGRGILAASHAIFARIDAGDAAVFFETLAHGNAHGSGFDLVNAFRETCLRRGKGKRSEGELLASLIKVWNRRTQDVPVGRGTMPWAVRTSGDAEAWPVAR